MGAGVGIGIGLGRGMGDIAEVIIARKRKAAVDRDQRSEELLKKAGAIAANRTALAAQNPKDEQIALLDQQGQDLIGQANALYAPHEKSAFMQKIQQVFRGGRKQEAQTAKPRYSWEIEKSAAPRPTPRIGLESKIAEVEKAIGRTLTKEEREKYSGVDPADQKKPLDSKYHPSTGGLSEIVDPNSGEVWHAGNIAQAPPELQNRWKSIKEQEAATAKAKVKKVTDFQQFLLDAYGDTPTAEQRLDARRRWTGAGAETVGTHVIQVPQADGSVKAFEYTTTSRKVLPGPPNSSASPAAQPGAQPPRTGKSATPPRTPGEARNRIRDLGDIGFKTNAATQAKRDQAETVIISGKELIAKINAARAALGPLAGRISDIEVGLGSSDPTVRGLYGSLKSFAALQPALHGSRGIGMQKEFESASARMSDNPDAAIAAVQALIDQAKNFQLQPGSNAAAPKSATGSESSAKVFNVAKWKLANPGGDVAAAKAEAQKQGYQIKEQ